MAKKFFTATIEGFTFTRTSENRTYSHAIVGRYNLADRRADAERSERATWKMNLSYHKTMAAGGMYHFNNGCQPKPITADEQTRAQAYLDMGVEGHVAKRLAEFDATKRQMSSDGVTFYTGASWSSRLDLAQKQAKGLDVVVAAIEVTKEEFKKF